MAVAPQFLVLDPLADIDATIAHYESQTGTTLAPGAIERLILTTIAYRGSVNRQALQDACLQVLVDFATADHLDALGNNVGVVRLAPSAAFVEVEFTLVSGHGGVTIPQGTRIATTDGQSIFVTTADIDVPAPDTTALGNAECNTTGIGGNGYAIGTLASILDPQPYLVSATNTALTTGGADTESDAQLRERVKAYPATYSVAGARNAYRYWTRTASALIVDVGVDANPGDGTVTIYPLMADGSTTPSGLITAIEEILNSEEVRPATDTVIVLSPTQVAYDIEITITPYSNGAANADIEDVVTAALTAWTTTKRQTLGKDVKGAQIIAETIRAAETELGTSGNTVIFDTQLIGWTDVVVAATEFPFLGTLTINFNAAVIG